MSPVLLWFGSSLISPMEVPAGEKSTSVTFSACLEKTAKFMPSGIMVAPGSIGEPGAISKDHFGVSETVFITLHEVACHRASHIVPPMYLSASPQARCRQAGRLRFSILYGGVFPVMTFKEDINLLTSAAYCKKTLMVELLAS
jgi:hypothetical protein